MFTVLEVDEALSLLKMCKNCILTRAEAGKIYLLFATIMVTCGDV